MNSLCAPYKTNESLFMTLWTPFVHPVRHWTTYEHHIRHWTPFEHPIRHLEPLLNTGTPQDSMYPSRGHYEKPWTSLEDPIRETLNPRTDHWNHSIRQYQWYINKLHLPSYSSGHIDLNYVWHFYRKFRVIIVNVWFVGDIRVILALDTLYTSSFDGILSSQVSRDSHHKLATKSNLVMSTEINKKSEKIKMKLN